MKYDCMEFKQYFLKHQTVYVYIRGPFHKAYSGLSYILGKNFFLSSFTIPVLSYKIPMLCLNFKTGKSMS